MNETNWLPGLFALALAFAIAGIYLLFARKRGAGTPAAPLPEGQEELERRAQTLLDALRELKQSRHQMSPEVYQAEVNRLEREAASALRARDEGRTRPARAPAARAPGASAPAATFFDRHPQLKGAVWGGGVVVFFVALGLVLSQESRKRDDGQEATGRVPPSGMPAAPTGTDLSREATAALERLKANPADTEAAALATHELIQKGLFSDAQKAMDRGLAVDPFHVELRVHRAVLRALRQEVDAARTELQQLVDLYPGAQEGLLFLAGMEMQAGNRAQALDLLERFAIEVSPEQHPPQLVQAIADLRLKVRGADVAP
ncbi:MAG: hypothetical protein L0Y66_07465 [Myxococcaceae bacterium]|nr:hypothetical protein [Myxococcaceae bacterium]